jgi:undecaprenyl-diphosphatase
MAGSGATVVALLAVLFARSAPVGLDEWGEHRDPTGRPWRSIAEILDTVGTRPVAGALVVAGIVVCLALRRPSDSVLVALASICSPALAEILKPLVGRRIHQYWLSYPSGHVAFATGWALALALVRSRAARWDRRRAGWALPGIAAAVGVPVGWAVVCLNSHYVSDAFGGAATAFFVVPAIALAIEGRLPGRGSTPASASPTVPVAGGPGGCCAAPGAAGRPRRARGGIGHARVCPGRPAKIPASG